MSRQIKFRAWHPDIRQMVYEWAVYTDRWSYKANVAGETVPMQYTGLRDKNGREIYEGDIVRWSAYPSNPNVRAYVRVVQWSDAEARFKPDCMGDDPVVEVIGNRYENPGLLEAQP